jgi:hypothetical protein
MLSSRETRNRTAVSKKPFWNETDDRFLLGPGEKCTWGHRMQNTRDHAEIVDLKRAVGLAEKESNGAETNGSKSAVVPEQNGVVESPAAPAEPTVSNIEPAAA